MRRTPGFDGEYGVIRLFDPGEVGRSAADALFDVPATSRSDRLAAKPRPTAQRRTRADGQPRTPKQRAARRRPTADRAAASPHEPFEPMLAGMEDVGTGLLDRLDAMQRVAASAPGGPMLIVAGPGTGKTRTLTHRIAYLCADMDVFPSSAWRSRSPGGPPRRCASGCDALLGPVAEDVTVSTFHALVPVDPARAPGRGRAADRTSGSSAEDEPTATGRGHRRARPARAARGRSCCATRPDLVDEYRPRWPWVFVDEYQDVDAVAVRAAAAARARPTATSARSATRTRRSTRSAAPTSSFFLRFAEDFADARVVRLTRNYRSSAPILATAVQAIAPTSLVRGRRLDPARLDPEAPQVGLYPAASVADEADFVVRTIDELVGGLSHRSLDSGRVDCRAAAADGAVVRRHRRAVPHRRPGRRRSSTR